MREQILAVAYDGSSLEYKYRSGQIVSVRATHLAVLYYPVVELSNNLVRPVTITLEDALEVA